MIADLFTKDLIVVTGKGGVGKTTVAAALGSAAAARGLRTIIAEVSARDDVSRAFATGGSAAFQERRLADGLNHISIDPQHAMEEYLADQLPVRALAEVLVSSRMFGYLAAATPGMRELLTVGKVWELAQADRRTRGGRPYDLVILDAPATGHGVAILSAPRTFAQAARVGPIARQGNLISELFSDPRRTAVVAVATPEEMPVNETLALRGIVKDALGLDVGAVVVNGVLPERLTAAQSAAVDVALQAAASTAARHAIHVAGSQHARARAQRGQLMRLRRGFAGDDAPVVTLPQLPAASLGVAEFEALGRKLAGKLA